MSTSECCCQRSGRSPGSPGRAGRGAPPWASAAWPGRQGRRAWGPRAARSEAPPRCPRTSPLWPRLHAVRTASACCLVFLTVTGLKALRCKGSNTAAISRLAGVQWEHTSVPSCINFSAQGARVTSATAEVCLPASPCSLSLVSWQGSSATLPSSSLGGVSKEIPSSGAGAKPGAAARALQMPRCLLSRLHLHAQCPDVSLSREHCNFYCDASRYQAPAGLLPAEICGAQSCGLISACRPTTQAGRRAQSRLTQPCQTAECSPRIFLAAPPDGGRHQRPALSSAHSRVAQRNARLRGAHAQLQGRLLRSRLHNCMSPIYIMLTAKHPPLHADAAEGTEAEGMRKALMRGRRNWSKPDRYSASPVALRGSAHAHRAGWLTLGIIRHSRWLHAGLGQGFWRRGNHAGHAQAAHGAEV